MTNEEWWLWIGAAVAVVVATGVILAVVFVGGDPEPSSDGPVIEPGDGVVSERDADEAVVAADEPPVGPDVFLIVEDRVELWGDGQRVAIVVDDLADRRMLAGTSDGTVVLASNLSQISAIEVVARGGIVTTLDLDPGTSFLTAAVLEGRLVLEMMVWDDSSERGDLVHLDVESGLVEIVVEDAFYIDANVTPIGRTERTAVSGFFWIDEREIIVTTASGDDPLLSPSDGRYGSDYAFPRERGCVATDPPHEVDELRSLVLGRGGDRLAWIHREVDVLTEPWLILRRELRVLDVRTGEDGAIPLADESLGALVGLSGPWAVFESGTIDIRTAEIFPVAEGIQSLPVAPEDGLVSVIPVGSVSDPVPPCPEPQLSIYGFGDLVVGEVPTEAALLGFRPDTAMDSSARCLVHGGTTVFVTDGVVQAISVTGREWTTPSGIGVGTLLPDVWASFRDRLLPSLGSDPDTDPQMVAWLDFEPADPAETHLGIRFIKADAEDLEIVEMRGGLRAATRGESPCW